MDFLVSSGRIGWNFNKVQLVSIVTGFYFRYFRGIWFGSGFTSKVIFRTSNGVDGPWSTRFVNAQFQVIKRAM